MPDCCSKLFFLVFSFLVFERREGDALRARVSCLLGSGLLGLVRSVAIGDAQLIEQLNSYAFKQSSLCTYF